MKVDRKAMLLGAVIGFLLSSAAGYADIIWHQKIRCEVVIPRTIRVNVSPGELCFGECEIDESIERQFTITNQNDYDIDLMWTDAKTPNQLELMSQRMFQGSTELLRDESVIHLSAGESVTLTYSILNEGESGTAGSDVTYHWTLKIYLKPE